MKLTSLLLFATALLPFTAASAQSLAADTPRRLIAIDNVCAWPNLLKLNDGTLVAIVFNQTNHGRAEGDVDCWGSADGLSWKKLSTITQHEQQTNRMNHAAGLNANGDLVVLCNGWDKVAPQRYAESRTIQTVVCISRDGGRTWTRPQQLVALEKSDCGYPDAIELPGGRLIVAYYADRITQHQRYHMGVINLSVSELH